MYILLKTDDTNSIKIQNGKNKAHYFYADTLEDAKLYLDELKDTEDSKFWSKYNANSELKCCEEFNNYLKKIILEPNKLSKPEIMDLCSEYKSWMGFKPSGNYNIGLSIPYQRDFKTYWERLVNIIDQYTQTRNNIQPWDKYDEDFNPVKDLGLILPFNTEWNLVSCGALSMKYYKLIYYFDFLGIEIKDSQLRSFWEFFKKTLNVYAIGPSGSGINVIPKPNEIFIKDEVTHCIYGEKHYCDGIKVPAWLYYTNKNDLKLSHFNKITNVDIRSIFIKKAGIEKLIKKGIIIDSWENYPDNEWWAKSEYKLIDMSQILVEKIVKSPWSKRNIRVEYYDYAPFLCMKNQTTGEYHLEGVSPNCRDLYDALKMRYKDLDLPSFEIKDIK